MQEHSHKENLKFTKSRIDEALYISKVIHAMQIERGLSVGFITKTKISEDSKNLLQARDSLDRAIYDLKSLDFKNIKTNDAIKQLSELQDTREKIDFLALCADDIKNYYTNSIALFLDIIKIIPNMMEDKDNRNYIQAYAYLATAKESLGQIRANLNHTFNDDKFSNDNSHKFLMCLEIYNTSVHNFLNISSEDIRTNYIEIFRGNFVDDTFKMINVARSINEKGGFGIDAKHWFLQSTKTIDLLRDVEEELFKKIDKSISYKISAINFKIALIILLFLASATILVMIIMLITKNILSSASKLEKKYSDSLSLLEQYKHSVDESSIVSKTDTQGIITYVNDEFCKASGYKRDELIFKSHNILRHPDMKKETFEELWHTIKDLKKPWIGEIKNLRKDKSAYWVKAYISPILDSEGEVVEYISIRTDITELINKKKAFEEAAIKDPLSGFGNRYKLIQDIKNSTTPILAVINIDSFREINDFYGHSFGDEVIIAVANKISLYTNKDNFYLYRLHGDEFVVLAQTCDNEAFLNRISNILIYIKSKEINIESEEVLISCSCGVSFEDKEHLLSSANMALKVAKQLNRDVIVYSEMISLNNEYKNNIKFTKKLTNALKNNKLIAYYQPIVNNQTLEFNKYEILARMIDEDDKVISPFFFLDIAKKTRKYFDITKSMIVQSFERFKDNDIEFSINLSIKDILEPTIVDFIKSMLESYKIGNRVVFEIVESESIEKFQEVTDFINEVKEYGCKIAIDDFGTGYSNFEYLIKLRADYLKIDGSLIKNIDKDKNALLVVSTIVDFAKKFAMQTIAEFVENEEIFKIVKELGIDYSQGYYFSQPKATL